MAIGPRLDLRQTQSLVMTPQLRQAIKLLQYSNVEVAAFIEEELERNPLLERDEAPTTGRPPNGGARPAARSARTAAADAAETARSDILPTEAAAPLDADHAENYDPGGAVRRRRSPTGAAARTDFGADEPASRTWRSRAARCASIWASSFACPSRSGRPADRRAPDRAAVSRRPADRRSGGDRRRMGCAGARRSGARADDALRPTGLFARDLRECLAAQLAERNRLDPAMARCWTTWICWPGATRGD